jgi:hypothetical protein
MQTFKDLIKRFIIETQLIEDATEDNLIISDNYANRIKARIKKQIQDEIDIILDSKFIDCEPDVYKVSWFDLMSKEIIESFNNNDAKLKKTICLVDEPEPVKGVDPRD